MILSIRAFAGFVLAASAVVLGTALLSQYWGGLAPCELCLLQRWPWGVAITISLVTVLVGGRAALPWVALILAVVFAAAWRSPFITSGSSRSGSPAPARAPRALAAR